MSETQFSVVACDHHGVVMRAGHDGLGLALSPGDVLVEMVDLESMDKTARLIEDVRSGREAIATTLNVAIDGELTALRCLAWADGEQIWLALLPVRRSIGGSGSPASAVPAEGELRLDDFTRLYNDLAGAQREVARKNAELEAARKALEARQVELEAANERLDALATTDELTGISNRRAFEHDLEMECSRARLAGGPLALMLLDLDRFKDLNDEHGHQAGDRVLRVVGAQLASSCRENDRVARYGGEEFAVILPGATQTEAMEAAERLRQLIGERSWPWGRVTVSIGVAMWAPDVFDGADLVGRADEALYDSKESGRDRVTRWARGDSDSAAA